MKKLERRCPVCTEEWGEVLCHQQFILPEGHPLASEFDIVVCKTCGCVYSDTPSLQEEYNYFYKEYSKYEDEHIASGGGIIGYDKTRLERVANDIISYIPNQETKILDIGTGNGGLLKILYQKGYKQVIGMDPSEYCVQNLIKNNIQGFKGDIFNCDNVLAKNQFDFIILSHVLEHIKDVQACMHKVLTLLKPKGCLYIEVPDASRYDDYYIAPFHYFDIEHINHFDIYALKNLCSILGLRILQEKEIEIPVSNTNKYPSVFIILQKEDNIKEIKGIVKNKSCEYKVVKYINSSSEQERFNELEKLASTQEEIVVWGVGSFTMRMMAKDILGKCNIIQFIDINEKKQGTVINGIKVSAPMEIKSVLAPIVICSALYSDEIVKDIQAMGLENRIIKI